MQRKQFVAEGGDPWTMDDLTAVTAMQKIWNAIYGEKIPYKITTNCPVFAIVSLQELYN